LQKRPVTQKTSNQQGFLAKEPWYTRVLRATRLSCKEAYSVKIVYTKRPWQTPLLSRLMCKSFFLQTKSYSKFARDTDDFEKCYQLCVCVSVFVFNGDCVCVSVSIFNGDCVCVSVSVFNGDYFYSTHTGIHTHTYTLARTFMHTHTENTHAHTHIHTRTHTQQVTAKVKGMLGSMVTISTQKPTGEMVCVRVCVCTCMYVSVCDRTSV